jgi:hypothetical protein
VSGLFIVVLLHVSSTARVLGRLISSTVQGATLELTAPAHKAFSDELLEVIYRTVFQG